MKNRTLKNFYYGNLVPTERQMMKGSEISHVAAELSTVESLLQEAVGDAVVPLLDRYEKAYSRLNSITAEANYIDGFKTGAQFMMEILDDSHENLEPITE